MYAAIDTTTKSSAFSRQHYQGLDVAKDLLDAVDILSDGNFFEEILFGDGAQNRDRGVGFEGRKHHGLAQKRILDIFRQIARAFRSEFYVFQQKFIFEHLVGVTLLGIENPVPHLVVDGQKEEE